ncbi:MAG: hypothetical protein KDI53_10480, partial [Candidatus Accumulibacter sp.]|nr:hypothetical protein [Accumulibacter sp.]
MTSRHSARGSRLADWPEPSTCEPIAEAAEEICDGLDNDCDGVVDDAEGVGRPCEAGVGACSAPGLMVCGPEGVICGAVPGLPAPERCDGADNDCNGFVDDVEGVGERCSAGEGACAVAGRVVCTPAGPRCDAVAGAPSPEACDGVDNDCNGIVDDAAGVGQPYSVGRGACA